MKKISIFLTLLCLTFSANVQAQNWDDEGVAKKWQNDLKKEDLNDRYRIHIKSPEDLAAYAYLLNTSKTNTAELNKYNKAELVFEDDINLSTYTWRPLSELLSNDWEGSIDGQNHTISNMRVGSSGNDTSGFIDSSSGEVSIKNLNFKDCTNNETESRASILIGNVKKNGKLTIENVNFINCHMNAKEWSGTVCGYIQSGSTVTIKDVTINNCRVETRSDRVGGAFGLIQEATIKATNVKIGNTTVNGTTYIGGFIGLAEFGNKFELDKIHVTDLYISGDNHVGGIIGEWQGGGWMHNSLILSRSISYSNDCGGLVGTLYGGHTSVTIQNCVADVRNQSFRASGNVGGAVGKVSKGANVVLLNTTVRNKPDWWDLPHNTKGLLIGNAESSTHISLDNTHIDDGYIEKKDLKEYALGKNVRDNVKNIFWRNFTTQSTCEDNAKSLFYIAKSNESGSMMAPDFYPLASTDSMVVRYEIDPSIEVKVSYPNPIYNKGFYNENIMVGVGKEMKYTFTPSNNKWIVEDLSTGVGESKRVDEYTFSALPSDNLAEKHVLKFHEEDIPQVISRGATFDRDRQAATIEWGVVNAGIAEKYWGKDGYWQILRDGVAIGKVPYDTLHYSDNDCKLGAESKYTIKLVSPSLFYDGNGTGTITQSITCSDDVKIEAKLSANEKDHSWAIESKIPNSKRFNGCRVSLYRYATEDYDSIMDAYGKILYEDKYRLTETIYNYQEKSNASLLPVTLYDTTNDRPCTMFHYFVVCDNFEDAVYKDRVFVSNEMQVKPSQSVVLTSMNAAKGESSDKIRIEWKSKFKEAPAPVRYTLWRKKYDSSLATVASAEDNTGWGMVYEVNNNYTTNSYVDETMPGYVYKYRLRAQLGCDGVFSDDLFEDERFDIGYTASRGTIMGSISFGASNTSVEGVDVRLALDSLSMTNKGNSAFSRYFSGKDDRLPLAPNMGEQFWQGNWTLQFLMRPLGKNNDNALLRIPGMKLITLKDNTLSAGNQKMAVKGNDYTRVLISHKDGHLMIGYADTPKENGGKYANWVIDVKDADLKMESDASDNDMLVFGADGEINSFCGMLDEVRLWNIALNDNQVKNTYDRYLTGNESNLAAYYTFDSGVVEYAFDESHPDGIWSKHHTTLPVIVEGKVLPSLRSDLCPSDEILCYRGTTDRNGEYQIAGIPFTGEGTNYMVVPIFGTHEFQPSSTRRYVSTQSLTHSNVNFTDISSFPVTIQAYYALGNYPAEGLSVVIDNSTVTGKDGNSITTDMNGRCTVSVPIGKHRIRLSGMNHTMVNDGYPCSIDSISDGGIVSFLPLQDADNLIDFQSSPVAPFTFFDNTYARVAGRVVGGNVESAKPLGANLSSANLGQVAITLEPSVRSGYNMNNNETRDIELNQRAIVGSDYDDVINSTTTYCKGSSDIVIKTDPTSGEFLALIPPVSMRIKDIHTTGSHGKLLWDDFNTGNQSDLITIDLQNQSRDSINVNAKGEPLAKEDCHLFEYHAKKIYTYFVDPEISVVNPDNMNGDYPQMLGDSIWVTNYQIIDSKGKTQDVEDVVKLWTPEKKDRDGSPKSYMLNGLPVFTQGNEYSFDISLYEKYHNCDTGSDSLYFIPNVEVKINNALATKKADVKVTNGVMNYTLATDSLDTTVSGSADGKTRYTFTAGFPNPLEPYTLDMTMTYETNGKVYTYPAEGSIKGYVFGHVNVPGTDFVTAGPDIVSFVLRDPPGGSSTAWIEQGTTISSTASFEQGGLGTQDVTDKLITATGQQQFIGEVIGVGAAGTINLHTQKSQTEMNTEFGVTTSWSAGTNKSTKINHTITQKLQTSSAAPYVGAMGDIYVGCSTNLIYSKSRILGLRKSSEGLDGGNSKYALEQYDGMSQTISFPTTFNYSQRHILQELIPKWKEARRGYVTRTVDSFGDVPTAATSGAPEYYVLSTTSDDKNIWERDIDYVCRFPQNSSMSYADTINVINNYILGWQKAIEDNERTKVCAMRVMDRLTYTQQPDQYAGGSVGDPYEVTMEYGYMGNVSYDAGAAWTSSMTRETSNTKGVYDSGGAQGFAGHEQKFESWLWVAGAANKASIKVKEGYANKGSASLSTSEKQTFGYTLSDSKFGNYYSIDTWLPGMMDDSGMLTDLSKGAKPKLNEFYVFRLAGGQSMEPYEPEDYTLFYKENGKPVKISEGTIAIQDPVISSAKKDFTDIPNGQKFSFPITLGNKSTAIAKIPPQFTLNVDAGSNPDGLKFFVDGMELRPSGGYEVRLMPGESITKTVEVEQAKTDIIQYKGISFRLGSTNEYIRSVADTLNFYYKPASSPVVLTTNNNMVNSYTPDLAATFQVSDYQPNFEKFAGIRIQYKGVAENTWHLATTLVKDSVELSNIIGAQNFPEVWQQLDVKNKEMRISIPMDKIADGEYTFRAQSFSPVGNVDEVTTESELISIIKDTAAPTILTRPTPTSDFYTGREDISIEMNEPIDMTLLTPDNFSVTGVLNDAEVRHMSGLHFDGNTPAHTQSRVDVFGKSSTIAFWYKPQVNKKSCLFSQQVVLNNGTPATLALTYNEDATMTLSLGNKEWQSDRRAVDADNIPISDWMYATVIIDRANNAANVFNLFGTSDMAQSHFIKAESANVAADCNVPLYVGGSADGRDCYADIQELVLFEGAQEFELVSSYKDKRHYDHLNILAGYWPMDEGQNKTAIDKVRNRNLILNGTDNWYAPVTNYALHLDGKGQYVKIKTDKCPIGSMQNYALELYFRTASNVLSDTQTLFSNGWGGNGSTEPSVRDRLSLSLTKDGHILFETAKKSHIMGGNYADRNWHHLVLSVERSGYARIFVDNEEINGSTSIAGSDLGGFSNSQMAIGALVYNAGGEQQTPASRYFEGDIDEVRLWNVHNSQEPVKAMAYTRLRGDETGLVAYYPFEHTTIISNQPDTKPWFGDCVQADPTMGLQPADEPLLVGNPELKDNGPQLKAANIAQPIMINYTHNGKDRITLTFPNDLDNKRIEGCTLTFSVKNLKDMAGNKMQQPVVWNLYVEQKSIMADLSMTQITQEMGQSEEIALMLFNNSAKSQRWTLDQSSLPSWLSAEKTSALIDPFTQETIMLKTSEATPIGKYSAVLLVSGEDKLSNYLNIELNVTSIRPDWTPEKTDGSVWMSVLGRLKVEDVWSTDESDMVAAFTKDGRCLGVASPMYDESMSTYFLNMNIRGNKDDEGKELFFHVWDASSDITYIDTEMSYMVGGQLLDKQNKITLKSAQVIGNFSNPCSIATRNVIRQTIALHQGWNWISLWVEPKDGNKASDVFASNGNNNILEVKSRVKGYSADELSKLSIDLSQTYLVYAEQPVTFTVEGKLANPSDIDEIFIHPKEKGATKWQWLGFPLHTSMTLKTAFSDFKPSLDDVIKSEDEFAMYNGSAWVGNLKYLAPGKGYMYGYHADDSQDITWNYPSRAPRRSAGYSLDVDPYDYENYTFVRVRCEGLSFENGRYMLAAIGEDDKVHGVESNLGDEFPLNIYGIEGEQYRFVLYDRQTNNEVTFDDNYKYSFDATTPKQTYTLPFTTAIRSATTGGDDSLWYNLGGVRIGNTKPSQRGVFINGNSKKVNK